MAENTRQAQWIVLLFDNLSALFASRDDVFIALDLLWYPVEREPDIQLAPDVLVVFGRPKGHRGSYKQWEEGGLPLTVVFEILSPGNTRKEMSDKQHFYDEHGVEEYYLYDPDKNRLQAFVRRGTALLRVRKLRKFTSPRLRITFDLSGPELVVRHPDGQPFVFFEQERTARTQAEQRADQAEQRADRLAALIQKLQQRPLSTAEQSELQRLLQPSSPRP
jgi:Uma2 family endonuclease